MDSLINLGIVILFFLLTELSAWLNHKYVMHGFLWYLHADHHKKDHNSRFERNDLFFVFYAVPCCVCIWLGVINGLAWYTWAGLGVTLYGFTYFFVHDIIIHQRFRILTRSENLFILALRRAHKMHHKHQGREHGESFGMLFFHPRYWKEARKIKAGLGK